MKLAIKEDGIYIDGEKLDLRKCTEIDIKGINPIEDAEVSIRICPDEVEIDTLPRIIRQMLGYTDPSQGAETTIRQIVREEMNRTDEGAQG